MTTLRIIIPVAAAIAVTFAGLFVSGKIKHLELELTLSQTKLATIERANASNVAIIRDLEEQRKRDLQALSLLIEKVDTIRSSVLATNAAIRDMERTNEEVRDFLSLPLPDDLRRLLNEAANSDRSD